MVRPSKENRGPTPAAKSALDEARRLFTGREYAKAAAAFESAGRHGGGNAAVSGRALCLYRMGRLAEALTVAGGAGEGGEGSAELSFISGLALKDTGRYDEAIAAFNRAAKHGWPAGAVTRHRAAAHFLAGRLGEAERDLERAVSADPADARALYNLAVVRVRRLKWKEAARAFALCAQADPAGLPRYQELILEIGRTEASEEFHFRGHRIKNMLALLADTCRHSMEDARSGGVGAEKLEAIVTRLEKVFAEMSELLSFVKREPLELDVWDIHDIIESALFSAGGSLERMAVEKRFSADVPGLVCDAHALSEAFLNIILNAAEAMPDGGALAVRTSRCLVQNDGVRGAGVEAVRVEFEDTGGGVKADPPEKVFQFAFTTKPGGTGLGLCQASRAVGEHGGAVAVRNTARGACFTITLPLAPPVGETMRDISLRDDFCEELALLSPEGAASGGARADSHVQARHGKDISRRRPG